MAKLHTPRWAWALTGSGHFFIESFALIHELEHCDVFVSRAAEEVLRMYKLKLDFPKTTRVMHDKTASSVPVGAFYYGVYHTVVVAPATSNTVAKCVWGISDTLPTNAFAQAGKCRVPSIVFACDTAPEMTTMAPAGPVQGLPAQDRSGQHRAAEGIRAHDGGGVAGGAGGGDPGKTERKLPQSSTRVRAECDRVPPPPPPSAVPPPPLRRGGSTVAAVSRHLFLPCEKCGERGAPCAAWWRA